MLTFPMTSRSRRQIAMERLLEVCKRSKVADIMRAAIFLERAEEVRRGNRGNRTASRKALATASQRKAAKEDNPLTW